MSKRIPKSVEEKLEIVNLYLEKGKSISSLIREYGVSDTTIRTWVRKYKQLGIAGLKERKTWTRYSKEVKEQAVQDYLNGTGSTYTICDRYQISSRSVLEKWIKRYTSGKEIKATSKGLSRMNQGRKTTFEERVEIVNFTIIHDKDYQAAIEKYGIFYQ